MTKNLSPKVQHQKVTFPISWIFGWQVDIRDRQSEGFSLELPRNWSLLKHLQTTSDIVLPASGACLIPLCFACFCMSICLSVCVCVCKQSRYYISIHCSRIPRKTFNIIPGHFLTWGSGRYVTLCCHPCLL